MISIVFFINGVVNGTDAVSRNGCRCSQLFERAEVEAGSLALGFGAKSVGEWLGLDDVGSLDVS